MGHRVHECDKRQDGERRAPPSQWMQGLMKQTQSEQMRYSKPAFLLETQAEAVFTASDLHWGRELGWLFVGTLQECTE